MTTLNNTSRALKIYLIAGEPSGDLLGARLMRALRAKTGGNVEFFGLGGDTMEAEGLKSVFDISDLAVMGLVEVIPSIPKVLRRIRQTVSDIRKVQPDIVVTIDSWSFSSRVHKALRKLKLGIPQLHYVAPQVWAWKKKRARTMYKYIDALMTLLPHSSICPLRVYVLPSDAISMLLQLVIVTPEFVQITIGSPSLPALLALYCYP